MEELKKENMALKKAASGGKQPFDSFMQILELFLRNLKSVFNMTKYERILKSYSAQF